LFLVRGEAEASAADEEEEGRGRGVVVAAGAGAGAGVAVVVESMVCFVRFLYVLLLVREEGGRVESDGEEFSWTTTMITEETKGGSFVGWFLGRGWEEEGGGGVFFCAF